MRRNINEANASQLASAGMSPKEKQQSVQKLQEYEAAFRYD